MGALKNYVQLVKMINTNAYLIKGQEKGLLDEKFDLLIILDACRYDVFKGVYRRYFSEGKLNKAVSPATSTLDWLKKLFPSKYEDITYISANPYCNSKNIAYDNFKNRFNASDHFSNIVDVWEVGWDDDLTSVPPDQISKTFLESFMEGEGRFILHYIQPHVPYIGAKYKRYINRVTQNQHIRSPDEERNPPSPITTLVKAVSRRIITTLFGEPMIWRIKKILTGKETQVSSIYLLEGWEGIRKAYLENLELVLGSVKKVVESFDGKVLITADHGEFLGEYGLFGHPDEPRKAENTEVPWFTIQGGGKGITDVVGTKKNKKQEYCDEELIKKRLAALGYM